MGKAGKIILASVGTLAAWAIAVKPRTKDKPDMSLFLSYDYANGGLHDFCKNMPEHTLKSYELAVQHGYGVVMDVRITKDGVPVVFADHELWRMCSKEGTIEDSLYEEIKDLKLLETEEKIPTLKEALELVDGQVPVLIQLKDWGDNTTELCENTSLVLDEYEGIFAVESLDYKVVRWFMRYREPYIRAQMLEKSIDLGNSVFEVLSHVAKNFLLTNCLSKPDFISTHIVDRRSISLRLCRHLYHVPVMYWTICTLKEYETARLDDAIVAFEDIEP